MAEWEQLNDRNALKRLTCLETIYEILWYIIYIYMYVYVDAVNYNVQNHESTMIQRNNMQ